MVSQASSSFPSTLTSREIVELLALEVQRLFISEQIGVIQGCLVHELERLGNQENWEDDKIDFPSHAFVLQLVSAIISRMIYL